MRILSSKSELQKKGEEIRKRSYDRWDIRPLNFPRAFDESLASNILYANRLARVSCTGCSTFQNLNCLARIRWRNKFTFPAIN